MHWLIFAKEDNLAVLHFLALSEHYSTWLFKKETLLEKKYPLKKYLWLGDKVLGIVGILNENILLVKWDFVVEWIPQSRCMFCEICELPL